MQLKASTDYALRTVLYLAIHGGVCSSKNISKDANIPRDYLIQLAQLLRNAGIIDAKAGKSGGYVLAKDPQDISFLAIINAIEDGTRVPKNSKDELKQELVKTDEASPIIENMCNAMNMAFTSYDAFLDSITIDTLIKCSKDAASIDSFIAQSLIRESERLTNQASLSA